MSGLLRISLEQIDIPPPMTKNFERYLFQQQVKGKVMLSFEHEGNSSFLIYFGEVGEGDLETSMSIGNIQIAPWKLYVFNPIPQGYYGFGEVFSALRLVDDYADIIQLDDPVEMVDISTNEVVGMGTVVGIHKFRLGAMTDEMLRVSCYPRVDSKEDLRKILEYSYEQEVCDEDMVVSIVMRVTSPINLDTRGLVEEDFAPHETPQHDKSIVARLLKRLKRN